MSRPARLLVSGLLALACLAMAAQIVRLRTAQAMVSGGTAPIAASLRPQNGEARGRVAEAALAARQFERAAEESRAALRHSPLVVSAAYSLGQLAERSSGAGSGDRWLRLAGAMGWRHRPTQFWALQRALLTGDVAVAAARVDALLRIEADPRTLKLVRLLAAEPRATPSLVERLAKTPLWRRPLLDPPQPMSKAEVAGAMALIAGLRSTAAPPEASDIRGAQRDLIAQGDYAVAIRLDQTILRRKPDAGSLIDDGGFNRPLTFYQGLGSALDWAIGVMPGASASLDSSGGNPSVAIAADGWGQGGPMFRHIPLAPGRYRLRYAMRGEPDSPELVGILVGCATRLNQWTTSLPVPLRSTGWEQRQFDFTVSPDCPLVRLALGSISQGSVPREAQFDDLRLTRL